jgi:hypothetical protein
MTNEEKSGSDEAQHIEKIVASLNSLRDELNRISLVLRDYRFDLEQSHGGDAACEAEAATREILNQLARLDHQRPAR